MFIVTIEGYSGSCVVSRGTTGFGYLQEGTPAGTVDGIAVDGGAGGAVGAGTASWNWGRADARIATIEIDIAPALHVFDDDSRVVSASVGGGYWLGWWPGPGLALTLTGRDRGGNVVARIRQMDDGWVEQ